MNSNLAIWACGMLPWNRPCSPGCLCKKQPWVEETRGKPRVYGLNRSIDPTMRYINEKRARAWRNPWVWHCRVGKAMSPLTSKYKLLFIDWWVVYQSINRSIHQGTSCLMLILGNSPGRSSSWISYDRIYRFAWATNSVGIPLASSLMIIIQKQLSKQDELQGSMLYACITRVSIHRLCKL